MCSTFHRHEVTSASWNEHNTSRSSRQHFVVEAKESSAPSDLLLSGLGLQDVLLPDGVEHAALPAEVSEALFLIVPVHLHNSTKKKPLAAVCIPRIVSNKLQDVHLGGQAQDEHGETLHDRGVLVDQ